MINCYDLTSSDMLYFIGAKLESKTKSYQWEGRDDGATEQIVLKRVKF